MSKNKFELLVENNVMPDDSALAIKFKRDEKFENDGVDYMLLGVKLFHSFRLNDNGNLLFKTEARYTNHKFFEEENFEDEDFTFDDVEEELGVAVTSTTSENWEKVFDEILNNYNSCILDHPFIQACIENNISQIEDNSDFPGIIFYKEENIFFAANEYSELIGISGETRFYNVDKDITAFSTKLAIDNKKFDKFDSFCLKINIFEDVYITVPAKYGQIKESDFMKYTLYNQGVPVYSELEKIDENKKLSDSLLLSVGPLDNIYNNRIFDDNEIIKEKLSIYRNELDIINNLGLKGLRSRLDLFKRILG